MSEEDWKQKYLASLDRHEQQEQAWAAMETLLRQGLTRVALAAEGLDAELDGQLARLRKLIRQGVEDYPPLESLIEELSQTVMRLDDARQQGRRAASPQQLLSQWLDSIQFPREARKQVRSLRRNFVQAAELTELEAPLRELAALVNQTLREEGGGGSILSRLFSGAAPAESAGPQIDDEATPQLSEFCLQLLDTLSLPAELTQQVDALKDRLSRGLPDDAVAPTLSAIADLISAMRRQMEEENKELQQFLLQLTERLQELDQHLAGAQDQHRASRDSGRKLGEAVQAEVQHIATTVSDTHEPSQLKALIQSRLDAIQLHLDEHYRSDAQRQEQLEAELAKLNERVRDMEKEGQQLRRHLKEKHEQAMRDPLTGLHNRLAYQERMEHEYARWKRYRQPLVLIVLDVDRFKVINDSYGHKAGDKALKLIANQLQQNLRECDFLARFGGEEFVAIMPETRLQDAQGAADKLRQAVEQCQFHYQGQQVPITISAGMAELRGEDDPDRLFQRADHALYLAKEAGRNRVHTAES
jgi:diguanylate cyclase